MDERRRSAAVEVDRLAGAVAEHHVGELEHRQPDVDPDRRPSQAHRQQRVAAHAERRARVAPIVMSESNCSEPAAEALVVVAVGSKATAPPGDQQRAGLQRGRPAAPAARRRAPDPRHAVAVAHHARAARGPRPGNRLVARPHARRATPRRAADTGRVRRTRPPPRPARPTSGTRRRAAVCPGRRAPARACARGHGERRRPSSSRRRRARGARAGTRSHGPYCCSRLPRSRLERPARAPHDAAVDPATAR